MIVNIVLFLATMAAMLAAGLFYAYAVSVNPGLGRLPDAAYLAAMQNINRVILNPLFFMSFMGAVFLLPASTYLQYSRNTVRFWWLLAASVVYVVGVFGVTVAGNVPLNNSLDAVNLDGASAEQLSSFRATFEKPWNALNTVRTLAAVITAAILAGMFIFTKDTQAD
ncbi:DUF1772 domain-containing protein [Chitinophaga barathri]|uniref:DUF1772 domain-containing protein n=1 Tax=Chitinophaga barathri TaxID=1647451 RepID=A0A3N4M5I1_9BACT|nr:anthrone oxygenase family protein [Chitinophaga barathri]RPD38225.1 DUF1772 domain-containing protein [Chitinophaga barathri]